MRQSRRRFILASIGTGVATVAGCVADETNPGNGTSPGNGNGDDKCEPLELPLEDEPPHDPARPPQPTNPEEEEDWDEHYLGDGMDSSTDLAFERINLRYLDRIVDQTEYSGASVYHAELITTRDTFEESLEPVGDESIELADTIDFGEQAVVVTLSGFGSSSVTHEWVRVEQQCEDVRLHGYYRQPWIQTSDYTTRTSGVVVERPDEYDLERAWVSLTVDENTRVNIPGDGAVHVVNGNDDDSELPGPLEGVQTVPVERESAGDWRSSATEDTGVAVHLEREEEVRALVEEHENVDRLMEATDFDEDAIFFLESAGPNSCYDRIDVSEIVVVANDDGYFLSGNVAVVDDSDAREGCLDEVTFPATLMRVDSEVELPYGRFQITDGWDNAAYVKSIPMSEFAKE